MTDKQLPPERDAISGVETTGHEWDGLKELNNPAPRWWIMVWLITIVWAVGYWVVYPAWPTLSGHTKGVWEWTEHKELASAQAEISSRQVVYLKRFEQADFAQVMNDPELFSFAVAGGRSAFKDNCATCHGTGAAGGEGYPNLNDDDWIWGGSIEDIHTTLRYGIRSAHPETRQTAMPAFGKDAVLDAAAVNAVTDYVLTLSGGEKKTSYDTGMTVFAENCAACHGEQGKGGREFGAPNLADKIWLYGGERAKVYNSVFTAHAGVMPAWEGRLDANTIRQLAVYVHSLGGGEKTTPVEAPVAPEPVVEPAAAP
jgi:cytochrome c oxidase cbb3-type subunit III